MEPAGAVRRDHNACCCCAPNAFEQGSKRFLHFGRSDERETGARAILISTPTEKQENPFCDERNGFSLYEGESLRSRLLNLIRTRPS